MKCSFFKPLGGATIRCTSEATHLVKNYYVLPMKNLDAPACPLCAKRLAAFPNRMKVVAVRP